MIENNICREWYASQGKSTRVESKQICAGHEEGGRDSCWVNKIFSNQLSNLFIHFTNISVFFFYRSSFYSCGTRQSMLLIRI